MYDTLIRSVFILKKKSTQDLGKNSEDRLSSHHNPGIYKLHEVTKCFFLFLFFFKCWKKMLRELRGQVVLNYMYTCLQSILSRPFCKCIMCLRECSLLTVSMNKKKSIRYPVNRQIVWNPASFDPQEERFLTFSYFNLSNLCMQIGNVDGRIIWWQDGRGERFLGIYG